MTDYVRTLYFQNTTGARPAFVGKILDESLFNHLLVARHQTNLKKRLDSPLSDSSKKSTAGILPCALGITALRFRFGIGFEATIKQAAPR